MFDCPAKINTLIGFFSAAKPAEANNKTAKSELVRTELLGVCFFSLEVDSINNRSPSFVFIETVP
jgi:hypothetical protein